MTGVPDVVATNLRILEQAGVWHLASENHAATSCADAAPRRNRLGYVGIPLADELKSWVGADANRSQVVVLHCRGNRRLDLRPGGKVDQLLGYLPHRLEESELAERFGQGYGLVTPFEMARHESVQQVFDEGVVADRSFAPHTMMTNLGHRNHGVEFNPRELVPKISNASLANIVEGQEFQPAIHTLGILTGNSPESGILLWERINSKVREKTPSGSLGDTAFPRVIIESVPEMGLSMELRVRESAVRQVVVDGVRSLCESGATLVAIACNTTQFFSAEVRAICQEHGASFVSIVDETAAELRRHGVKQFSLLAIGDVSDLGHYSDFGRLQPEFDVLVPTGRGSERIGELAFRVKAEVNSNATRNQFNDVVKAVAKSETVLLALTELSIIYAEGRTPSARYRIFDTIDILSAAMADRYLIARWALEQDQGEPTWLNADDTTTGSPQRSAASDRCASD